VPWKAAGPPSIGDAYTSKHEGLDSLAAGAVATIKAIARQFERGGTESLEGPTLIQGRASDGAALVPEDEPSPVNTFSAQQLLEKVRRKADRIRIEKN